MLSQRVRIGVLAVFGGAAAFFVFGGFQAITGQTGSTDPESAVPKSAFLVATANLAELRRSPLSQLLLGDNPETALVDKKTLGIEKLEDACGFDPLTRVETLAVAVPEDGEKGELGVAAKVTVTGDELEKCTTALAAQRGQKAEPHTVHGFGVVEAAGAKLAYGHGGLLLAGKGGWVDTMLATANGELPSYKTAEAHASLRASLRALEPAPTVVVSALLPRSLRDRIRTEMAGEATHDAAANTMAGVLGVSGVGAAIRAGASGSSINLAAVLVCDTDTACESVEKLVSRKRFEWSKELMLRMIGLGPLLDSIAVKRDGSRITVTASAPADQLAATIDRVLRLRAQRRERTGPLEESPPPPPRSLHPDEQIRAKP